MKVAILGDDQNVARRLADCTGVTRRGEVSVFIGQVTDLPARTVRLRKACLGAPEWPYGSA
jgi:hypothetical protein